MPFYWTFLPFSGYTLRMPIFSRISHAVIFLNVCVFERTLTWRIQSIQSIHQLYFALEQWVAEQRFSERQRWGNHIFWKFKRKTSKCSFCLLERAVTINTFFSWNFTKFFAEIPIFRAVKCCSLFSYFRWESTIVENIT